jgi:hypothetical protein
MLRVDSSIQASPACSLTTILWSLSSRTPENFECLRWLVRLVPHGGLGCFLVL